MQTARENQNTVLAISKSTKLKIIGNQVTNFTNHIPSAYILDIDTTVRRHFQANSMQLLGRIFIAKLIQNGFHFRLDIDKRITRSEAIDAVRKLIGSDLVSQGYPETLRLAHILSTFTGNEVIGIQGFLRMRHGLRTESPFNIRRSLFGPYGSSWEAS